MQTLSIGKRKRVHSISFSPNGRELAAVCGDLFIRIWDLESGEVRRSAAIEQTSSGFDIAYLDQNRLLFAGIDLRWWDVEANAWSLIAPGMSVGRRLRVSPSGKHFVEVDQSRSIEWAGLGLIVRQTSDWDLLPPMPESANTTGGVAFNADGGVLATGHITAIGQRHRHIGNLPGGYEINYSVNEYDYLVHLREFATGKLIRTIDGWQQAVSHLAFSPDGAVLAGTSGPRLRIWDLGENRELALHKRGTKHFQGVAFDAEGRFLATVSNDETVRVWDARTWEEYRTYTWQIGSLVNFTFAPDGLRAAAGSDRGQIMIWDVD